MIILAYLQKADGAHAGSHEGVIAKPHGYVAALSLLNLGKIVYDEAMITR